MNCIHINDLDTLPLNKLPLSTLPQIRSFLATHGSEDKMDKIFNTHFEENLKLFQNCFLAFTFEADTITSMAMFQKTLNHPDYYIYLIVTHQDHRNKGLASRMYRHINDLASEYWHCETARAKCRPENKIIIEFFMKRGFKVVDVEPSTKLLRLKRYK